MVGDGRMARVSVDVRELTEADQAEVWALGSLAFGYADRTMPAGWTSDTPGRRTIGVFDGGRMVAKAVDREQSHWVGGRLVPASGVAGVVVVPERRGAGLARVALRHLLALARDRGAAVSALFDTTPFPYRAAGWEEVATLDRVSLPAATLARVRTPADITTRPAQPSDLPALEELFRDRARTGTGVMDRSGPMFDARPAWLLERHDGVSVVCDAAGSVVGYASWDRGTGYDASARLDVDDLVALTPQAARGLLAMLAGWHSVTPNIALTLVPGDPIQLNSAMLRASVIDRRPWMFRVVDARAAVAARGWPTHLRGVVELDLVDELCPWHTGPHRLTLDGGVAGLEPGGRATVTVTPRGLALWYLGAASPRQLRRAGLLHGGDDADDVLLAAATAGPPPALLDYF
jgi:predicted acetyltransferase